LLVLLCLLALMAAGFLYFSPIGRQMVGLAASPTTAPRAVAPPTATIVPPVPTATELPPATATSAPVPPPTQPPSDQEEMPATPTAPAPPAPTAVPSPALTGQQRLDDNSLFDDFSSDALGWSQRNNETAETGYENEQYFIRVKQPTNWVMSKVPGDFPHTVIEFDAAVADGSVAGMYGVICHFENDDNLRFRSHRPGNEQLFRLVACWRANSSFLAAL